MPEVNSKQTWYVLEERQDFSQSLLWGLQRDYFSKRGVEAWRQEEVPHYISSNPTIARAYAEIIFAFSQDQQHIVRGAEPLYICELGAGSGRFAFHFLSRLTQLCRESGVAADTFRYILTDFTQSNLDAWRCHPRFQPFFENGLLDMALFDVSYSSELALQLGGTTLTSATLQRPLVVIANYLFDSVPQDLFYFKDQVIHNCRVSLKTTAPPNTADAAELLKQLHIEYEHQVLTEPRYAETTFQTLLEFYGRELDDAYLYFPELGLRCLQHLKALSQSGLLLLSADRGEHLLNRIAYKSQPGLSRHGSFSISVNYHAFQDFCLRSGGIALLQEQQHQNIEVVCLLMLDKAETCLATRRAYQKYISEFSPDDFFILTKHLKNHLHAMTAEEILSYLRFNLYDAHQLGRMLPRMMELAPSLSTAEIDAFKYAMDKVWEGYFPIREERDLAFDIGSFFYELDEFAIALSFFQRTQDIYGQHTGTLYNIAVCHQLLNQPLQAVPLLQKLLHFEPANVAAATLLAHLTTKDNAPSLI